MDEITQRKKATIDRRRQDFIDEENHYKRIARVFNNPDGLLVAEWILSDLCGFWLPSLDAASTERYNVGRSLFNAITMADIQAATTILQRRRDEARKVRYKELEKIEMDAKIIA